MKEEWVTIPEFTMYNISSFGRVFNNRTQKIMKTSHTPHGHVKITLRSDWSSERFTRSVAKIVAECFVLPPNILCDAVVILDGNLDNVAAENLVWRPRWFEWKYTRQLKENQPLQYHNLYVYDKIYEQEYDSVIHAGMSVGLLFVDIWRSTYMGNPIFPTGSIFEVNGGNVNV